MAPAAHGIYHDGIIRGWARRTIARSCPIRPAWCSSQLARPTRTSLPRLQLLVSNSLNLAFEVVLAYRFRLGYGMTGGLSPKGFWRKSH